MVYPADFEIKTGFDIIRRMVTGFCLSEPGKTEAGLLHFSSAREEVEQWLIQTEEFRQITLFEEHFPSQDYYDLTPALHQIRIPGTYLEPELLSELRLSLITIAAILQFLEKNSERYPALHRLRNDFEGVPEIPGTIRVLTAHIFNVIDERAQVRSTASKELSEIRREMDKTRARIEKRVMQIFRTARDSGWTPDDAEVTVRDGQLVIPMINTHKRKISGFVRDESATGHTVYMEPTEMLEMNNDLRELALAEHREIIRILTLLADEIRPWNPALLQAYLFLGRIDFIRAKALFANETGAVLPIITGGSGFSWRQAVHPLLYLKHKPLKKTVVPLDITLDSQSRILVISGPNAGGKSICLKTVGLLQYMVQCGLLLPLKEDSEICLFEDIFIDIGDEQSIDNDLSTYTSKLLNTKYFIEHLHQRSLFLIDEMGTGTDPSLGGAIAEASLEAMTETGAFGVVTTHYSNLKLLAGRIPGVVNGAMLFDSKKMKPLYKLQIGAPGSSFAFEIAENIGFPEQVLKAASGKTGQGQLDFHRQLQDLEVERQEVSKKNTAVRVADEFLSELIAKYENLNKELETSKKTILAEAKAEAARLLKESNRMIEKTIREIRESQAEKEKTKEVREELTKFKETVIAKAPEQKPAEAPPRKKIIPTAPVTPASPYKSYMDDLNRKLLQFELTLDIRGKRVEEAYSLVQRYIDDAILLSLPEVRILHGKGNGVLRQVTRDYLKSVREVKKVQDERLESGGAGITVVIFH
ncbi:MAG TPA: Smr/MutS family protein [Bacteroidales bacterium]|nr:Smr/MutS family protein [Bacteroidales bacterium]HPS73978.1 Smr/MutS family protein [Bacteroidales bacterium]